MLSELVSDNANTSLYRNHHYYLIYVEQFCYIVTCFHLQYAMSIVNTSRTDIESHILIYIHRMLYMYCIKHEYKIFRFSYIFVVK